MTAPREAEERPKKRKHKRRPGLIVAKHEALRLAQLARKLG